VTAAASGSSRRLRAALAAVVAAGVAALAFPDTVRADEANAGGGADLLGMSIEQLMEVEVTSVSRKNERLAQATSAVYVITQDDIRRSGARTLPDALRLAPGITVLRIDGNKWAIGSRGIVGRFANKLLVMMDGRVLYSTIFSGVFWDAQWTSLDDIDRIEVIRGPGGTVWGTNAVAGVINIITRKANVESGSIAALRMESDGTYGASVRHAGRTAGGTDFRVFLRHQETMAGEDATGRELGDDWRSSRIGGRIERALDDRSQLTAIAEIYQGESGMTSKLPSLQPPYYVLRDDESRISGGFVSGHWSRSYDSGASTEVRMAYDVNRRTNLPAGVDARAFDIDVQQEQHLGRHSLVFGGTYRYNRYRFTDSELVRFDPGRLHDWVLSAFVQDDIEIAPERLRLTLGSKFERNSLADRKLELMPSARLLWQPDATTNVWGAVTRAIRTPSQGEKYMTLLNSADVVPPGQGPTPLPLPMRFVVTGDPTFGSEHALSYEAGVRRRIGDVAAIDLAAFHMRGRNIAIPALMGLACSPSGTLVAVDPACLFTSTSVVATTRLVNGLDASVSGGELVVDVAASERWRLKASYSYAKERLDRTSAATSTQSGPQNQMLLQSDWRLTPTLSLDAALSWVDAITSAYALPEHWQGRLHLNWTPNAHWQISLTGYGLFDSGRIEYQSEINDVVPRVTAPRAAVQVRWTF